MKTTRIRILVDAIVTWDAGDFQVETEAQLLTEGDLMPPQAVDIARSHILRELADRAPDEQFIQARWRLE